MHLLSRRCVDQFLQSDLVSGRLQGAYQVLARATRLRDAKLPEVALALAAIAVGQTGLWHMVRGPESSGWAGAPPLATVWWGCVSLPVGLFLFFRSLWRWGIWAAVLWGFSRLDLRPIALHPDRCGGLRFLGDPTMGFVFIVLSIDCLIAGTWGEQILFERVPLESCALPFTTATVLGLLVGLGPLCVFSPCLVRARYAALRHYDLFALKYVRLFQRKWIERGESEGLLGSADIQSMADLVNTVGVVRSMRVVPFGVREVVELAAAVWIPVVPLVLMTVPLEELLKRIAGALL
jgi:hypothetical protein